MTPDQGTLGLFDAPPYSEVSRIPRFVVEIGPGRHPIALIEGGIIGEDDSYLGVENLSRGSWDNSPISFSSIQADVARLSERGESVLEIKDIGRRSIPVADHMADEVYMGNVIGELRMGFPETDRVISEAVRILKKEGVLSVLENIMPAEQRRVKEYLMKLGLVQLNEGKEKDEIEARRYNKNGVSINRFSYLLKFGFQRPIEVLWLNADFSQ